VSIDKDRIVKVRRHWSDWKIAAVHFGSLRGFHWRAISGGIAKRSPRPFVHAYMSYMSCQAVLEGELSHSCEHGPPPHEVLVCWVAKDNNAEVMKYVKVLADERSVQP